MGIEENKEVVRRVFEEVRNGQNYDNVNELIHPDFLYSHPRGDFKGQEGFKDNNIMWRTAFPDLKRTIIEILADGDMVSVLSEFNGTFNGAFMDFEPTGKHVEHIMAQFYRFKDGKVIEMIPIANMLSMFQQMDVNPTS